MNRKLHNTFTGLIASSALVLGLLAAWPATLRGADVAAAPSDSAFTAPAQGAQIARDPAIAAHLAAVALQIDPRADTAAPTAEAASAATLAGTLQTAAVPAAVEKARHKSGRSRRIRQSMAMPFFSFAPRG